MQSQNRYPRKNQNQQRSNLHQMKMTGQNFSHLRRKESRKHPHRIKRHLNRGKSQSLNKGQNQSLKKSNKSDKASEYLNLLILLLSMTELMTFNLSFLFLLIDHQIYH